MANKHDKTVIYLDGLLPKSYMTLQSRGLVRSTYLYCWSAYGHQSWQAGDRPWGASIHVTPPFGHMVLPDHMTN